jgi:gliding motility-associated-like protein
LEGAVVDDIGLTFVSYGFYLTDDPQTQPTENAATGDASGFTANISGLTAETTYYFMPYGVDGDGEIWTGSGDPCQFTTPAAADLPVLTGCDISEDETTTTFIGTVGDNGGSTITECGFYWGTTDVVADLISSGTQVIADAPVQSGDFSATLNTEDLPATYYFVPYATNASGTAYGDGACATLTPEFSCSYSNLSSASVTLEGAVVDDIGITFVSYGFYMTDDITTQPSENAAVGDATGFAANISGLTAETTYYFMPYGVDGDGHIWTGSGDPCQFTTPAAADLPLLIGCDMSGDETTTTFIGTVADNGGSTITECGFYWGTTDVVADLIANGTQVIADAPVQSGDFSATLNNADLPATFYFVPYATNASGIAYGDAACSMLSPEFSCSYSNLTSASVTLEGAVVDDIGITFVSYGFYLTDDMTAQPSENAATGDATGFTADITALSAETTYYYMPYGVDGSGEIWTGSDDPCQFTTPAAELTNLFIPNAFTPNGDGINDKFVITGIESFPDNTILVVNRWGNKVFETEGYNNEWDGKNQFGVSLNKDGFLPEGIYFYILNPGNGSDVIKGSIYLKRE